MSTKYESVEAAINRLGGRKTMTLADLDKFEAGVKRILALMLDYGWHRADEIRKAAGVAAHEASEGLRRMRQLRDTEWGAFHIDLRRVSVNSTLYEYRLIHPSNRKEVAMSRVKDLARLCLDLANAAEKVTAALNTFDKSIDALREQAKQHTRDETELSAPATPETASTPTPEPVPDTPDETESPPPVVADTTDTPHNNQPPSNRILALHAKYPTHLVQEALRAILPYYVQKGEGVDQVKPEHLDKFFLDVENYAAQLQSQSATSASGTVQ